MAQAPSSAVIDRRAGRVDEALRLSEERFALAMKGANDGLWDRNLLTDEVYYSPRWKSMLGYAEHEVQHTLAAFDRLVHPKDRISRLEKLAAYMSGTTELYEIELRMRHKEGHYVTVLSRAAAARDVNGRVIRMVGTHVDITDKKRAEQRLAAQYAAVRVLADATTLNETVPTFLRAVCEAAGWDLGCALVVGSVGTELSELTHWRSPSVDGGPWESVLQHRSYRQGQSLAGQVWSTGRPLWSVRADEAANFPADARAAGMNSACVVPLTIEGRVAAVLEFYSCDVRPREDEWFGMLTSLNVQLEQNLRRRQIEREIEEAERKYHDMVEQSLHGIYQSTPDGRIVSANAAFARALGYSSSQEILDFQGPFSERLYVDSQRRSEFKQSIEADGAVLGFEARMRRKDGAVIWVSIDARVVRDEAGAVQYYEGVLTDISDRKEAEQMKSDFISFVTHQLRTPLTGIKWLLELAHAPDLPEEIASYLQDARTSADRLIRLVNDLLDASRLESGRLAFDPKPTDLAAMSDDVVAELAPLAQEKNQRLTIEPVAAIPPVLVDPKLAREVILNLASNALRYTPEGGTITVVMRTVDGAVEWAVRDTGIGVPISAQQRLFEKFYRADNASIVHTEGTGLGLYMVRLIVERFGGRVWYESAEGVGSTFRFTLPFAS